MIVSALVFLLAVSAVAGAGAYLVEAGLRALGRATRFIWLVALALGPALVGARALSLLMGGAPKVAPDWAPVLELPPITLAPAGSLSTGWWLEGAVAVLWLSSGLAILALVARTHRVLLREREDWESTQVLGRDVYVSTDRGPAVAGMWEPWVVLPRWVLALPENELRMVLLHEEEHVRARDTRLLGGALALVALSAWNPLTWWQLRRLRTAMEVDCDRRVLKAIPDRATYGASLLTVAARASGPSLGLAAFTERSLNLKRRILAMTAKTSPWTAVGGGVLVVLGLVVGVQACGVETPVGLAPTAGAQPLGASLTSDTVGAGAASRRGGQITLFTQEPRLLNRDEIIAAMESEYPPLLRDAGVTGTARVYMFVDTLGTVTDVRISVSSGHQPLDAAALRVAGKYRFDPARNEEAKVGAWVAFPMTFGPTPSATDEDGPKPTPFTVAPSILNREEVVAAMEREYPAQLRELGVGGTVRIYFFIDEEGNVARAVLDRSSGNAAIDEAALKVAQAYRFSPALNRDDKVPVWVSFPVTFQVR